MEQGSIGSYTKQERGRSLDTATDSATSPPTPWYAIQGAKFEGSEPWFFETAGFPGLHRLEEHWREIREEIREMIDDNRLQPYLHPRMSFPPGEWKTMGFSFWKFKVHNNSRRCPKLAALLDSIPNLTAASVSVLEPGTKIHPHYGDTNAIARVHLGLDIPGEPPDCAFQVGEEIRAWKEGKIHAFCDAHFHMAWNYTDRRRIILIVDVMRPEFVECTDAICGRVLASIVLLSLQDRFPFLQRAPRPLKDGIVLFLQPLIRLILPLQRRWPF